MDKVKEDRQQRAPEALPRSDGSDAPQVVSPKTEKYAHGNSDGLQPVYRSESEGLQALDARPHYAQIPPSSEGMVIPDGKGYMHVPLDKGVQNVNRRRRWGRKWVVAGIAAAIVVVIAIAVGVGVGVTQGGGESNAERM